MKGEWQIRLLTHSNEGQISVWRVLAKFIVQACLIASA